ncbi:MAG TPA: cell wall-binding repeat-containing protein [Euzebya sp.]|nr:cell wall-binding repeat-containing protein [Euzebya sp.]
MTHTSLSVSRSAATAAVLLVLLLAHTLVASPSQAQSAGSIVFIKDGNVWVMAADQPATARAVTTDGTIDEPYAAPVMGDDGVIYAVTVDGFGEVRRMDQNGTPIGAPFRPQQSAQGIFDMHLSPDGQILAVSTSESVQTSAGFVFVYFVHFVRADGSDSADLPRNIPGSEAAWYSNTSVTLYPGAPEPNDPVISAFDTYTLGEEASERWFATCEHSGDILNPFPDGCDIAVGPEITRQVDRLAAVRVRDDFEPAPSRLLIYDMAAPPPAEPTRDCAFDGPEESGVINRPTWSPDGNSLAWSVDPGIGDSAAPPGHGLWMATGFASGICEGAFTTAELVVPGGQFPYWSAAPLGGGPVPTDPPVDPGPGTSTPPQPDEPLLVLPDGARLDGGGSADPVGQAVETSSQIWADDGADLVVLATADQFPDALAGSALAGEFGPILVTPFGDTLDSRVEAEIARVTGGDGLVLILGGVAAVSEPAAIQARAAAGSATCPQPFPTDCRYAGSGREETAALIGQSVLALHDGSGGRALLARGDMFADAITGGAYAAEAGVPILLTPPDQLNASTRGFIEANGISEVIVLGGTAAVAQSTVDAVPVGTRRIAGGDRTATAAAIATQLWDAEGIGGGGIVLVNVRHDDGWQTALSAAVVSALANAPQLGVENPPNAPSSATTQGAGQVGGPVAVFGSPDLVSDEQFQAVHAAIG